MGSSGTDTPTKASKASSTQEQQPPATSSTATPAVYPDWSSYQGYPPIPPHGFFPSPVASTPQGHPYMWGAQPMIPPYGTPPPPYVMYPPGVYAHPSMPPGAHPFTPYAMTSPNGNTDAPGAAAGAETDGKASEGKDKSPTKRSKGSLGSLNMLTGKSPAEHGKTSGASANGAVSQSGESGSESSSEGSEANSQNDSHHKGSGQEQDGDVRSSQNGVSRLPSEGKLNQTMAIMPMPSTGPVPGPTTNLNIGMDYWGTNTASSTAAIHGKGTRTTVPGAVVPGEQLIQDERELKRQKRKQSNRESARRSRLRKQAECEELAQRAEVLKQENSSLRGEVNRIRKEYEELLSKNNSLKEKLGDKQHKIDETGLDNKLQHSGDDVRKKGN